MKTLKLTIGKFGLIADPYRVTAGEKYRLILGAGIRGARVRVIGAYDEELGHEIDTEPGVLLLDSPELRKRMSLRSVWFRVHAVIVADTADGAHFSAPVSIGRV